MAYEKSVIKGLVTIYYKKTNNQKEVSNLNSSQFNLCPKPKSRIYI